ncbi:hypothetical protein B0H17DRAFT_1147397 [Mycena rosella]|uniref:Uncharacterized protein n=1 Tax=Mycena rosella TaxID=1033263 RepID=A0AAD7CLU8_MYCRO|nr:hypothetical protein B0H17DRAFT_1147397 [Mycena rosella]
MTAHDYDEEYIDPDFIALLANLDLQDRHDDLSCPPAAPTPPPHTLSPLPPPYTTLPNTFPTARGRTLYLYESPTRRGTTTEWSVAGAATQGVPSGHVRAVQPRSAKKKPRTKKAAYAVFCGRRCGVFCSWYLYPPPYTHLVPLTPALLRPETEALVAGVPNCIFHGYTTVALANAAFAYAQAWAWTRVTHRTVAFPIPGVPHPATSYNAANPLHGSETLDDLCKPNFPLRQLRLTFTRSLESQLNTLGHAAALQKYTDAVRRGDVEVVPHTYYARVDALDPFL